MPVACEDRPLIHQRRTASHRWAGAELVSARGILRVARRQRLALVVLGTLALLWRLAPVREPEPLVASLIVGAAVGAVIESLIAAWQRDRADMLADELIERGFNPYGRADPVSRAIDQRIHELDSERTRCELADSLRWHVDLERQCRTLPGARCAPIPPICGFAPNADLVASIATAIERGPCDPRITIRINRLLATPTPAPQAYGQQTGSESERVREALLSVQSLIDKGPCGQ
jgi:hypothetical protein